MANAPQRSAGPRYSLDRITAVPAIIGEHKDFLFIGGLAGTAAGIAKTLFVIFVILFVISLLF